ncbi:MAG: hypothetical protein ACREMJ_06210, partial [Gemmatimonadales bacterium]
ELPDMSGIDACRALQTDVRIGHRVPILLLGPDTPSPEQRVAALRAGAWGFLPYPRKPADLSVTLETYVQAKRNIEVALAEGLLDPTTGLHTRPALARRARELGALMSRVHGALACVVLRLENGDGDARTGNLLLRTARVSDVVGKLSPRELVVLAPGTDRAGAVKLAVRAGNALRVVLGAGPAGAGAALRAGYDAVGNLTYSPIDPVELLTRTAAAVRHGAPEPGHPWVRRFESAAGPGPDAEVPTRSTPPGLTLDKRRTSP